MTVAVDKIIEGLNEALEHAQKERKIHTPWELFGVECGRGWSWIVVALMQAAQDKGAYITQIKEKFGSLRFYYTGGDDELDQLVTKAKRLAEQTCEVCGEPGKLRVGGWMQTLCDEHDK